MMSSSAWPVETIDRLITSGAISAHKDGNYGSLYPRVEEFGVEGVPFLTAKSLNAGTIDINGSPRLSDERANSLRFGFIQPNDVLLSHNATVGRVAIVPAFNGRMLVGTSLTYFRLNSEFLLPRYFAAYLAGVDFQNQLSAVMSHSTRNQVPITAQRKLSVVVPPLNVQEMIASTLGSLDDKIEQNRRTGQALEKLARATFKAWFVDFEPVKAKAAGQTSFPGMPPATFATLPDRFVDSELGPVPEGWEVGTLGDLCTVGRGSSPRPINKFMGGTVPWLKIADATAASGPFLYQTKEFVTEEGATKSVPVKPGDLILSNSASCGIPIFVGLNGCIHDGWLHFRNLSRISKGFLYHWLSMKSEHLVHIADGSVQKNLNTKLIRDLECVVPPAEIGNAFSVQNDLFFEMIDTVGRESRKLAELRDYLLPRLLSGRVRVNEAKK